MEWLRGALTRREYNNVPTGPAVPTKPGSEEQGGGELTKVLFVEERADLRTMIQDALMEVG